MIYIIITVLTSVSILICFRLFNLYKINTILAIAINYLVASSLGFLQGVNIISLTEILAKPWIFMALLMGCLLIVTFYLFAFSSQKAGVAITAVAARLSLLLPVCAGFFFFREEYNTIKIIGIILSIPALVMIISKPMELKHNRLFVFLPLIIFIANGCIDITLKTSQYYYIRNDEMLFLATAFFFSMLAGIIIIFVKRSTFPDYHLINTLLAGIVVGLLNWFSTYSMLKGMSVFEISTLIPTVNMGIVTLSALTGWFLFKENLKGKTLTGIITGLIAIFLLGIS